jgi:membrane-bound lytic murein transglycosylase D
VPPVPAVPGPAQAGPKADSAPQAPPPAPKTEPSLVSAERTSDIVLFPGEVDLQLSKNTEEEREGEPSAEFLVSLSEQPPKRDTGLYAGLTGRIQKFIRYFQTRGRDRFEVYLSRSGKYSDMMRGILSEYGLPGDLIYLALIESGFSPKAYSIARAAGPWQFITGTARRYGLRVDWWTDERRDYEKSTHAAASYLKDLYGMFDSWPLAAAAYNAGEGKILRAVTRYRSEDFVELIRHRYLARETKDYVPKMIAALSIAKEPEKYGFGDVEYEEPLDFEKVVIPGGTNLETLGRLIGLPYETLREWNPELRRFCTPPTRENYELRLPKGYGPMADERKEEIRKDARVTFLLHSVKKGETLDSLGKRYAVQPAILKELNGLKKASVSRSARLVIPVTGLSAEDAVPGKEMTALQVDAALKRHDEGGRRVRTARARKGNAGGKKEVRHIVRAGETVTQIATSYGVDPERLKKRNRLKQGQTLPRGRVLFIPSES